MIDEPNNITSIRDKIISAAYGDAGLKDRLTVWLLIRKNPEYKKLYIEYRKTALSVHKIQMEECPREIVDNTLDLINDELEKAGGSTVTSLFGRPVFSAAVAAIILAAVIVTFNLIDRQAEVQYSKQEILSAEEQVKSSLAIVSKLLNQTSQKLEEEILPKNVGKPIRQGFEILNQLFPKGVESDENS
ncbi:MAG: hypothetical protein R6W90_00870 [Ignavibacteriaceae bacterium]